jgi:uncharacterized protein (DUF302 family)
MTTKSTERKYTITRCELELRVSYGRFTRAFESLLGIMDVDYAHDLVDVSPSAVHAKLASYAGPSGFVLFQKFDHGAVLSLLTERQTNVMTYVFGNALIASQMTVHEPRVGLYVPLRLLVSGVAPERIVVTYDLPSATLGQFGSPEVSAVALELDRKVAQLVADAARSAEEPAPAS